MCSESLGVPDSTRPARPTAWSLSMLSHVAPRPRPKYFGFGRAWMLRTGTTNRIPSMPATRPPPHYRASAMSSCAAIRTLLAAV